MGNGFQFFDIVLLAMIAIFLILRLRNVLGRRNGNEKHHDDLFSGPDRREERDDASTHGESGDNVVPMPARRAGDAGAIAQIQAIDPSFSQQNFLNGARMAFEMVVEAFAHGNKETLRPLLSREVFGNFSQAIDERERSGEAEERTLVGIRSAEIVDAALEGRMAYVTVKFISEEVSVLRNASGEVVSGDPNRIIDVTDVWTFARNMESSDPNWQLVATESPD